LKRLFVILLVLCPLVSYSALWAQIYSTSSATYRSISTSGVGVSPATSDFRSTSSYSGRTSTAQKTRSVSYSTAPMRVANGQITTAASQLQGGMLAEPPVSYLESKPHGPRRAPWVPDENVPLGDGWDVALLLSFLCLGYAIYIKRKSINSQLND